MALYKELMGSHLKYCVEFWSNKDEFKLYNLDSCREGLQGWPGEKKILWKNAKRFWIAEARKLKAEVESMIAFYKNSLEVNTNAVELMHMWKYAPHNL